MENIHGTICAVGGGKGGVGKSLVSVNIACALALKGHEVILIDADLAGANVHTMFGIRHPPMSLNEFVNGTVEAIEDILVSTPLKNLKLICGATDFIDLANPGIVKKQKIIRAINGLSADYIVVDIGAGSTLNNLDFFNMADMCILVTTPDPTAILGCYEFLKLAVRRKILNAFADNPQTKESIAALITGSGGDKTRRVGEVIDALKGIDVWAVDRIHSLIRDMNVRLVVNCAAPPEGDKVHRALAGISMQYLNLALPLMGNIPRAAEIERSVRSMTPIMLSGHKTAAAPFVEIALKIASETALNSQTNSFIPEEPDFRETGERFVKSDSMACFNDVVVRVGKTLRIQTEDLGPEKSLVQTLVFLDGKIVFSRENKYSDLGVKGASNNSVSEMARWQHKGIVHGIKEGKIDKRIQEKV